jgi:hypothetical protein
MNPRISFALAVMFAWAATQALAEPSMAVSPVDFGTPGIELQRDRSNFFPCTLKSLESFHSSANS